jgi:hypothetical protein
VDDRELPGGQSHESAQHPEYSSGDFPLLQVAPLQVVSAPGGDGGGAGLGQPVHVQETTPLRVLLDWPLQDVGQRPFEQQPFEPRSSVVEHWAATVVIIIPSSITSVNVRVATSVCLIAREREAWFRSARRRSSF